MEKALVLLGVSLVVGGLILGLQWDHGVQERYYQVGVASWYGPNFDGQPTASGEVFDMEAMTAAHKSLPFDTRVKVVDLETGREVEVKINDRGPFIEGRIIDLSRRAAEELGIIGRGTTKVGLKIVEMGEK
ncbi:MAG: septal ring lytic transglycosylase RlpA family protein [Candidatus Bipolaricaulota bacterium]